MYQYFPSSLKLDVSLDAIITDFDGDWRHLLQLTKANVSIWLKSRQISQHPLFDLGVMMMMMMMMMMMSKMMMMMSKMMMMIMMMMTCDDDVMMMRDDDDDDDDDGL